MSRQTGMSIQNSLNALGFPPSVVQRARERGVHPIEIRLLRDDYADMFRPRWPWPCVTGLGRRMLDASEFYAGGKWDDTFTRWKRGDFDDVRVDEPVVEQVFADQVLAGGTSSTVKERIKQAARIIHERGLDPDDPASYIEHAP